MAEGEVNVAAAGRAGACRHPTRSCWRPTLRVVCAFHLTWESVHRRPG